MKAEGLMKAERIFLQTGICRLLGTVSTSPPIVANNFTMLQNNEFHLKILQKIGFSFLFTFDRAEWSAKKKALKRFVKTKLLSEKEETRVFVCLL